MSTPAEKTTELSDSLPNIEAVAASIHQRKVKANRDRGVFSEKLPSGEELMVPFEQLSDVAQAALRQPTTNVYQAIDDVAEADAFSQRGHILTEGENKRFVLIHAKSDADRTPEERTEYAELMKKRTS